MAKTATLSTVIDSSVKKAVDQFCEQRGLKLRYLVEQALVEQIEDMVDLEAYWARHSEETIPFHKILASRKKRK
ncbi:MAG: hypothetical protein A2W61_04240 [Deltaproteobacteria bacterium RIFCSPLOWO2_01_44_7]|nr:MAG: hypothetical protein A2712_03375 [Deltaproteobacteria bacterium RIFCSPHIGHO2_01_FULL_43_49]OGQ16235.1 MAG: hypothetical protein A3D22_01345 [Deltaproteobacteria bacterium RIFCSPHIGHO2_02_FULL_44_53]OGQ29195.1 MAG: hypothetical protein A3D98_05130 [Deltaproteobacteria bacterium RIFCSPHIGHO2_12_FULL_44_21]OGQ32752.1 MAG: hypothetical protein A2979_09275 [Deltaproteobacteria bacterium RIFCSPLOWO2_01_FULL_45_74]OGQ41854.1 MAG: hypothetical protein A3I70_09060 [Deltaproteobacteria bacterium 